MQYAFSVMSPLMYMVTVSGPNNSYHGIDSLGSPFICVIFQCSLWCWLNQLALNVLLLVQTCSTVWTRFY